MHLIRHLTLLAQYAVGVTTVFGSLASAAAPPADVASFMAIQRPRPSAEIRFGAAPEQVVDVFVPDGVGPHPAAILVHGGCWSVQTAGREQLRHLGADLSRRGIAAWSIGYRRANEAGGGYPGTYEDVARSAAAICGADIAQRLAAPAAPGAQVDPYADVSPAALPPPESHTVMVSALLDRRVAPALAEDHVHAMHAKGKRTIDLIRIADAGHFDLVTHGTAAWAEVLGQIEAALAADHMRKTAPGSAPLTPQPHEVDTR